MIYYNVCFLQELSIYLLSIFHGNNKTFDDDLEVIHVFLNVSKTFDKV